MYCTLSLQLVITTEKVRTCENRAASLEAEKTNMAAQIQQLQARSLKQEQQQGAAKGLRNGMKLPLSDKDIGNYQQKMGQILLKKEQQASQIFTKDSGKDSQISSAMMKDDVSAYMIHLTYNKC